MSVLEIIALLLMLVGLVGIVFPVLPGLLLVVVGVLVWALDARSTIGWVLLLVTVAIYVAGVVLQWAVPGKRLKQAGVRTSTLLVGLACAVAGMFVIPVVGLFVGFPVGILLTSLARTRDVREAWRATGHALRAVGTNILIELGTAFTIIAVFVVTVVFLT
ncbi:DUF456 domain-containing protein [Ornithinimicrobium pratense]|uniref:DUF456 domain-containing protein n=1 Tax=Ornithinimicrobium pratense TaxID=2593973 RepID=A0A5J6V555_9MICO|nr:DUF456 domain-containing protein [Ornithinimicrobium pratense]QFG68261.1 DUF456 domain-containing protein [Ornithinimicrobium pratense]